MKINNSDITIKCPQTGIKFHPKRLNQMFYTTADGWSFRNRLNKMTDLEMADSIRANLNNLKIIIGLLPNLAAVNAAKLLDIDGFDWKAANSIVNPFTGNPDDKNKCFYVYGFVIQKRVTRICIYDINTSELILTPDEDFL